MTRQGEKGVEVMAKKSRLSEKRTEEVEQRIKISTKVSDEEVGRALLRFLLSIGGQDDEPRLRSVDRRGCCGS